MMMQHTLTQLRALKLDGMARALEEQATQVAIAALSFEERFAMLLDRELAWRDSRRLERLLRQAKLKHANACLEDVDHRSSRGIDNRLIATLGTCDWLRQAHNVLLIGATGLGKTWLACALAQNACRQGFSALYLRLPRLFEELRIAHADGSFSRRLNALARADLIVLDDWGLTAPGAPERADLLEILDDRVGVKSTIVTSQLPIDQWHAYLGDPTLADAILDRLVHAAHRIVLKGESMRKKKAQA
jgi:DNA replication protein DnaC